ncbi:MAG: DUF4129 domain-containing protein [Planctomycetota bacterium]|nr:DUF4129 domain-containing protein [Planctomycetota bacterium]
MNSEQRSIAEIILELIAPALIMVLVGSFVMFLVEVFYQGTYTARLDIILMLFTFAAVLIGRISIEQDHSVAALYAIVLGIVTLLAMVRFVELTGPLAAFSLPINVGLLAIVWFFTHKLVWDCTFVDMTKDVTATGLLDSVGSRWKKLRDAFDEVDQLASDEVNPIRPTTPNQPAAPWTPFLRWLRHRKANTPGLWVIYFAVLTMPTFGIAQGFIPASDLPSRRWVFQLFVAYILASLGLLMTTSLIGLMRYLHGRRVEMPNSLMISWISVGSVVGVALLCLAWLLPRPAPEYSIAKSLPFSFKTPDSTRPNSWALGSDEQKSGVRANSSRRNGQQGQSGQGQSGQGQSGQGQSGQGQSGQGQSGQGQSGQGSFANGFSQFSLPPALTHVGTLIKILAAIALLTLLTWALLRYRKEILASYREWWSGLARWWSLFLGRKSRQRRGIDPVSPVAVNPLRPFTTFSNPFRGKLADQLSPDELVAMSFTALESWAQDVGHPRHEDQTPIEFAKSLTYSVPELGPSAQAFTKLVNQSAYAPNTLDRKCLPTVKRLWDQLEKSVPSSSLQHAK